MILLLASLLATAYDTAVQREGGVGKRWLLSIKSETLVILAVLADAGRAWLSLVRQVDDELADAAYLQRIDAELLDRAHVLRQDGGRLSSKGYTKRLWSCWRMCCLCSQSVGHT